MTEKRPAKWKWCLLVLGLAVLQFVVTCFLVVAFHPPISTPPAPPGTRGQPAPMYDAMVNVLLFPASLILRAMPRRWGMITTDCQLSSRTASFGGVSGQNRFVVGTAGSLGDSVFAIC
jgi:hypothetical protein